MAISFLSSSLINIVQPIHGKKTKRTPTLHHQRRPSLCILTLQRNKSINVITDSRNHPSLTSSEAVATLYPRFDGVPFPSINKLKLFLLSAVDDDDDKLADEDDVGEFASRSASALGRTASKLGRIPLPLLCLRRRRASSGSLGDKPLARANRFSTSVRLQTPDRRPDMPWPGSEPAGTATDGCVLVKGGPGVTSAVPGAGGCVARTGVMGAWVAVALGGRL